MAMNARAHRERRLHLKAPRSHGSDVPTTDCPDVGSRICLQAPTG